MGCGRIFRIREAEEVLQTDEQVDIRIVVIQLQKCGFTHRRATRSLKEPVALLFILFLLNLCERLWSMD